MESLEAGQKDKSCNQVVIIKDQVTPNCKTFPLVPACTICAKILTRDAQIMQKIRELLLCQTTKELKTWKLNEQQQQLVNASGLVSLIHTAGMSIDRSVLGAFCELWSKETNTARFHDFEMAPSLRDTAYILGVPVTGRVVTTGAVLNKSSEELFLQYLGQYPGLKLSWLYHRFSQLHEDPTDDEIIYSTRAYLLYLIGATLFSDLNRSYVSPKYLPLLSDFNMVREYVWGAAALAHLYKGLSTVAVSPAARKRLMGWIYEYIPATRPDTEDTPALVFPRVRRWTGSVISQPTKDIKKAFSQLRVSDVNWEPYNYMDPASIPSNCAAPDNVCFSTIWLISFNVREVPEEPVPDEVVPRTCLSRLGRGRRHRKEAAAAARGLARRRAPAEHQALRGAGQEVQATGREGVRVV